MERKGTYLGVDVLVKKRVCVLIQTVLIIMKSLRRKSMPHEGAKLFWRLFCVCVFFFLGGGVFLWVVWCYIRCLNGFKGSLFTRRLCIFKTIFFLFHLCFLCSVRQRKSSYTTPVDRAVIFDHTKRLIQKKCLACTGGNYTIPTIFSKKNTKYGVAEGG